MGDLRANVASAPWGDVAVVEARSEAALQVPPLSGMQPDAVVLDAPRTGLARGVAEGVCAAGPRRVVHLSCDPATLARDLAIFASQGYALTSVEGFDLFPQTPHVEALVVLER